jgi:hypothetical protein
MCLKRCIIIVCECLYAVLRPVANFNSQERMHLHLSYSQIGAATKRWILQGLHSKTVHHIPLYYSTEHVA